MFVRKSAKFYCINIDLNKPGCVSTPFKLSILRCLGSDFIKLDLQNCLDLQIKKNNCNNFVFAILSERLKPVV